MGSSGQHAAAGGGGGGGPKCKCVQHNWVLLFLVNPSGPGLNSPPSTNLVAFQAFAINGIFDDFFGCCQQDQFSVVVMFQKKRKKNQLDPDLIIFKDFFYNCRYFERICSILTDYFLKRLIYLFIYFLLKKIARCVRTKVLSHLLTTVSVVGWQYLKKMRPPWI